MAAFRERLEGLHVVTHDCEADVDHNRSVVALSGEFAALCDANAMLAEVAFDAINLNRHTGVYPRIGALDALRFMPSDGSSASALEAGHRDELERFAFSLAEGYRLPVYLDGHSERRRGESELFAIREGGFGSLFDRLLWPDFGPTALHPFLGVAVVGFHDFYLEADIRLTHDGGKAAREIAARIEELRREGDARFAGVTAHGWVLDSREQTEVHVILESPDVAPLDPIVDFVRVEASIKGAGFAGADLVGAIRPQDMECSSRVRIRSGQLAPATL